MIFSYFKSLELPDPADTADVVLFLDNYSNIDDNAIDYSLAEDYGALGDLTAPTLYDGGTKIFYLPCPSVRNYLHFEFNWNAPGQVSFSIPDYIVGDTGSMVELPFNGGATKYTVINNGAVNANAGLVAALTIIDIPISRGSTVVNGVPVTPVSVRFPSPGTTYVSPFVYYLRNY